MSTSKKIFLAVFALFIAGLNIALYSWAHSLKAEEDQYIQNVCIWKFSFDNQNRLWAMVSPKIGEDCDYRNIELRVYENGVVTQTYTCDEVGCSSRSLEDLIVDSTGRVWIHWQAYEGSRIVTGYKENWKEVPLKHSDLNIRKMAVDANGKLWIGTATDGLFIIDGNEQKNFTENNSGLVGNAVTGIAFDNQGRAWIGAYSYDTDTGGINIFDEENWETYTTENSPLLGERVSSIVIDKQNRVWIGTDKGITIFDGSDWMSHPTNMVDLYNTNQPRNGNVVSMIFDGQGRVWVNDTRVFDGKTWKYFLDPYHSGVNDTTDDSNRNIWVATNNGVVIIRPDSPQPVSKAIGMAGLAIAKGAMTYITVILLIAWISVVFNTWHSIGFSLLGLPVYFIWILMRAPNIESFGDYGVFILNPAVFGTIGGAIGGTVVIFLERHGGTSTKQWGLIGFVVGTVISFCILSLPGGIY